MRVVGPAPLGITEAGELLATGCWRVRPMGAGALSTSLRSLPRVTSAITVSERNAGVAALSAYAETMDYLSEHLASLRQEISDLSTANQRYSEHRQHSPVEQTASDGRRSRLLEIKRELSTMMNRPRDSSVWWDRRRK